MADICEYGATGKPIVDCARYKQLQAELGKLRWIPISEGLPSNGKVMEFCWRPIDYLTHPKHKEIVVGTFSYKNEQDEAIRVPTRAWINGRYHDIKTHITHYRLAILPEQALNAGQEGGI